MPNRGAGGVSYRYGFNSKETENDVKGIGNEQDYGMRIYDPRLGRFLSVDPLYRSYPFNSTYAFAENDVIRSIDLDGGEKIETTIFNEPNGGKPGLAVITINLHYQTVTRGAGSVNGSLYSEGKFSKIYSSGNLSLNLSSLPTPQSQAIEANATDLRSGNYYATQNFYNYNLFKNNNSSIQDGLKTIAADPVQNGLIFEEVSVADQNNISRTETMDNFFLPNPALHSVTNPAVVWNRYIRDQVFPNNPDARAGASNETVVNHPNNYIILRSMDPGQLGDLSKEEVLAHEAGHNSAAVNTHSTKGYSYQDKGLSSNQPRNVSPTKANTLNIINDPTNRANSSTLKFDNTKLKNR